MTAFGPIQAQRISSQEAGSNIEVFVIVKLTDQARSWGGSWGGSAPPSGNGIEIMHYTHRVLSIVWKQNAGRAECVYTISSFLISHEC